ncbi:MAG: phosphocholine cytidylyltransferase family protein [Candidatus Levybacteria bacterium]|nr:phosphocholine cytidylyltransferase family protein [Candidatus Levybacteria bacterium]
MKAIILTAGIGSRIRPLTDNKPKSLLEVNGKPILQNMLENIVAVGITEVIVITGYLEEMIKDYIRTNFPDLNVVYIRNKKYLDTNTGYSLNMTKDAVNGDSFIKFDADVIFEKAILENLVNDEHETALCIDRNINLEAEEVKAITTPDGKVLEVGKKLDPHKATGESIGIEKIGKEAGKVLFEELTRLMEDEANYKEYYDDSYTTLVNKGVPFYAVDITGLKWVEIDTHADYALAEEVFATK